MTDWRSEAALTRAIGTIRWTFGPLRGEDGVLRRPRATPQFRGSGLLTIAEAGQGVERVAAQMAYTRLWAIIEESK